MKIGILSLLLVAVVLISVSATWFIIETQFQGIESKDMNNPEGDGAEWMQKSENIMGAGKVAITIENTEENTDKIDE